MAIGAEKKRKKVPDVDLAAARAAVRVATGPEDDGRGADGLLPKHDFDFDYTDRRGRRWVGHFAAHVLTYRERIQVGLIRSNLAANTPPSSLDPATADLLEMIAFLQVSLDDYPDWASPDKLLDLYDWLVVAMLFKEVSDYEDRFHGPDDGGSGAGADSDSTGADGAGVVPEDGESDQAGE